MYVCISKASNVTSLWLLNWKDTWIQFRKCFELFKVEWRWIFRVSVGYAVPLYPHEYSHLHVQYPVCSNFLKSVCIHGATLGQNLANAIILSSCPAQAGFLAGWLAVGRSVSCVPMDVAFPCGSAHSPPTPTLLPHFSGCYPEVVFLNSSVK